MRWVVGAKVRADLLLFTGLNFSGQRHVVRAFPGGLQGIEDVEGDRLKSAGLIAREGIRVLFITSPVPDRWLEYPWRAIEIRQGHTFKSKNGSLAVQVPDLGVLDDPSANRADREWEQTYPVAVGEKDRPSWTYGRVGDIRCNITEIRIERISK